MTSTLDSGLRGLGDDGLSPYGSPTISARSPDTTSPSPEREFSAPIRREQKSHSRKKPANHIPRPRNAFIIFRSDFVAEKRVPGSVEKNHQNLSKIAGAVWKSMTDEDKREWYRRAEEEKETHAKKYPGYQYNPAGLADSVSVGKRRRKVTKGRGAADLRACDLKCKYVAGLLTEGQIGVNLEEAVKERDFLREASVVRVDGSKATPLSLTIEDPEKPQDRSPRSASQSRSPVPFEDSEDDDAYEIFPPPDPSIAHPHSRPNSLSAYAFVEQPQPRPTNPMSLSALLRPPPSPVNTGVRVLSTPPPSTSPGLPQHQPVNSYIGIPLHNGNSREKVMPYLSQRTSERVGTGHSILQRSYMDGIVSPSANTSPLSASNTHTASHRRISIQGVASLDSGIPTRQPEWSNEPRSGRYDRACTLESDDLPQPPRRSISRPAERAADYGSDGRHYDSTSVARFRSPSPEFPPTADIPRHSHLNSRSSAVEKFSRYPSPDLPSPRPLRAELGQLVHSTLIPFKVRSLPEGRYQGGA